MSADWLPELEYFERDNSIDYQRDWRRYEDYLYEIFKDHFINNPPKWDSLPLQIRRHPIVYGKEEAFYHIICKDYGDDGERNPKN